MIYINYLTGFIVLMANLRIVSNNQVTAVGGSATAAACNDYKSQFQTGSSFTVTTSSLTGSIAVVAVLAEDIGPVTMTVSGSVSENTTSSNTTPNVAFGGVKYVAAYLTVSGSTSFTVSFNKSVKISRFIIGKYWSPTHNVGYGVSVGYNDATTIERLQSGDQYVVKQPKSKTLQFDLQYLNEADKFQLFDILRVQGKATPIFVSVFPQDTYQDKEQMYSVYGRFNTLSNIAHTTYTMYSSTIQLEEF
jgi:hypothetical protein